MRNISRIAITLSLGCILSANSTLVLNATEPRKDQMVNTLSTAKESMNWETIKNYSQANPLKAAATCGVILVGAIILKKVPKTSFFKAHKKGIIATSGLGMVTIPPVVYYLNENKYIDCDRIFESFNNGVVALKIEKEIIDTRVPMTESHIPIPDFFLFPSSSCHGVCNPNLTNLDGSYTTDRIAFYLFSEFPGLSIVRVETDGFKDLYFNVEELTLTEQMRFRTFLKFFEGRHNTLSGKKSNFE